MIILYGSSPVLGTASTLIANGFTNHRVKTVNIQARPSNAGVVYIGRVNTDTSRPPTSTLTSTFGWTLQRGQEAPPANFGADAVWFYEFYALSATAGTDRVDWMITIDPNS